MSATSPPGFTSNDYWEKHERAEAVLPKLKRSEKTQKHPDVSLKKQTYKTKGLEPTPVDEKSVVFGKGRRRVTRKRKGARKSSSLKRF